MTDDTVWRMDPRGYFIIKVLYSEQKLGVRHYAPDQLGNGAQHDAEAFGADAASVFQQVAQLIASEQHAKYLQRELQKAERAMREGLEYVQDTELSSKKFTKDPSENIQRD